MRGWVRVRACVCVCVLRVRAAMPVLCVRARRRRECAANAATPRTHTITNGTYHRDAAAGDAHEAGVEVFVNQLRHEGRHVDAHLSRGQGRAVRPWAAAAAVVRGRRGGGGRRSRGVFSNS